MGTSGQIVFNNDSVNVVTTTAAQTLTNKSLDDSTVTFVDTSDPTKQIKFNAAGTTGTATTILSSQTTNKTITLPDRAITVNLGTDISSAAAGSGTVLTADGAGGASFVTPASAQDSASVSLNYTLTTSVAANAMTIRLKNKAGNDPSGGDPVNIAFRNTTNSTGDYTVVSATAATSLVIPSGASLGMVSAQNQYFYVYAINNAGTIELAVAHFNLSGFDQETNSSTTIGAGSTDASTLYSTTGRSNKAIRVIGRIEVNETTAGTYASNALQITLDPNTKEPECRSEIWLDTPNGYGSSSTKIARWTNTTKTVGSAITYADSSTLGGSFTLNEDGIYSVMHLNAGSAAAMQIGISLNTTTPTTNIASVAIAEVLTWTKTGATSQFASCSTCFFGKTGDVVRAHNAAEAQTAGAAFRITKVSN